MSNMRACVFQMNISSFIVHTIVWVRLSESTFQNYLSCYICISLFISAHCTVYSVQYLYQTYTRSYVGLWAENSYGIMYLIQCVNHKDAPEYSHAI